MTRKTRREGLRFNINQLVRKLLRCGQSLGSTISLPQRLLNSGQHRSRNIIAAMLRASIQREINDSAWHRLDVLEPRLLMNAQTLYWDTSSSPGLQGGSGSWSTTTASWNTKSDGSGMRVAWIDGANAVFSGSGTVTLAGNIQVSGITGANYTIDSGTMILTDSGTIASTRYTLRINSDIEGNGIFHGRITTWGNITGNVTFYDYSINYGSIYGDAKLYGNSYNANNINGDVTLNDNSYNAGTISGDATFANVTSGLCTLSNYMVWGKVDGVVIGGDGIAITRWVFNDSSCNIGTITGDAIFNGDSSNGGIVLGDATFSCAAGGTYTLSRGMAWWGHVNGMIKGGDGIKLTHWVFNDSSRNFSDIYGSAIFNGNSFNSGTIAGDAIFNNNGGNYGIINGNAIFNDDSRNYGTLTGNATFTRISGGKFILSGSMMWAGQIEGTIKGGDGLIISEWQFYDDSYNLGTISGDAIFNDESYNDGVINGNASFAYATDGICTLSGNMVWGQINGVSVGNDDITICQWIFNDFSYNHGVTLGDATFNDSSFNSGIVTGNAIYTYSVNGMCRLTGDMMWGDGQVCGLLRGGDNVVITQWVFDDNSINYGTISGHVTFNDLSSNDYAGIINGDAIFLDESTNYGQVNFTENVDLTGRILVTGNYQIAPGVTATNRGGLRIADATLTNQGRLVWQTNDLAALNQIDNQAMLVLMAGGNINDYYSVSSGATLEIHANVSFDGLAIKGGAKVVLTAGGDKILTVNTLNIDAEHGGTLDLADNSLLINYGDAPSPLTQIQSWLASGYAAATWQGSGITSSAAAEDPAYTTALGYFDSGDFGPIEFGGYDFTAPAVLVRYTLTADFNLDGHIDGLDYSLIDTAYSLNTDSDPSNDMLPSWWTGDLNYDGVVNGTDYTFLDWQFGRGGFVVAGTAGDDQMVLRVNPLNTDHVQVLVNGTLMGEMQRGGEDAGLMVLRGDGGNDTLTLDLTNGNPLTDSNLRISHLQLTLPSSTVMQSLNIGAGAKVVLSAGGDKVLTVNHLNIDAANGGTLDLMDNSLIINYGDGPSPEETVHAWIGSGFNDYTWTGSGITSSIAATDEPGTTAVGHLDNVIYERTEFAGQAVGLHSILVRYTVGGDTTLDGRTDTDDYFGIDSHLASNPDTLPNTWFWGDTNYDGIVSTSDYFYVDYNIYSLMVPATADGSAYTLRSFAQDGNYWELSHEGQVIETIPAYGWVNLRGRGDGVKIIVDASNGDPLTGRSLTISNLTLSLSSSTTITSLNIGAGAKVLLAAGGNNTLMLDTLQIAPTGQLDVADNCLILNYSGTSPQTDVRNWIISAASNNWLGYGIASSAAAQDASQSTILGYGDSDSGESFEWGGMQVSGKAVVVRYTWAGDVTLDGQVNIDDYNSVVSNFDIPGTWGWTDGDVTYDGVVNSDDYCVVDSYFGNILLQGTAGNDQWTIRLTPAGANQALEIVQNGQVVTTTQATGTTLMIRGGEGLNTVTVDTSNGNPLAGRSLSLTNVNLTLPTNTTLENLTIGENAKVVLTAGGDKVLTVTNLQIDAAHAGLLDLQDNTLIVNYVGNNPVENLRTWLAAGRGVPVGGTFDGSWTGTGGITSSIAAADFIAADMVETHVLGYLDNGNYAFDPYTTYAGTSVGSQSLIVSYTIAGDVNLDGTVDGLDDTIFSARYGSAGHWYDGDYNFNGQVDSDDATVFYAFYNFQHLIRGTMGDDHYTLRTDPKDATQLQVWHNGTLESTSRKTWLVIQGGGGTNTVDVDLTYGNPLTNCALELQNITLTLPASTTLANLTIGAGAKVVLTSGGDKVLTVESLSIDAAHHGLLDLTDNSLIVNYTGSNPVENLRSWLIAGRGVPSGGSFDGTWAGTGGITSSVAAADFISDGMESHVVGYVDNGHNVFGPYSSYAGVAVGSQSLIVSYTVNGDVNLDGVVNGIDEDTLSLNYGEQGLWCDADFNFDGNVDDFDCDILLGMYQSWQVSRGTSGNDQIQVAAGDLSSTFVKVITGAGDDTLVLNFSSSDPLNNVNAIVFDGGSGSDTLTLTGDGTTQFVYTPGANGTSTITVGSHTITLASVENLTVSGGTLTITNTASLDNLTIGTGGRVIVASGGDKVLTLTTLTIDTSINGGTLDLEDNDLIIHDITQTTMRSLLNSGYADGLWNGHGIISSLASSEVYAIGCTYAVDILGASGIFDGQSVVGTDMLARFTLVGDLNLDGFVDDNDLGIFIPNYLATTSPETGWTWSQGDVNYDGLIDDDDLFRVLNLYNDNGTTFMVRGTSAADQFTLDASNDQLQISCNGIPLWSDSSLAHIFIVSDSDDTLILNGNGTTQVVYSNTAGESGTLRFANKTVSLSGVENLAVTNGTLTITDTVTLDYLAIGSGGKAVLGTNENITVNVNYVLIAPTGQIDIANGNLNINENSLNLQLTVQPNSRGDIREDEWNFRTVANSRIAITDFNLNDPWPPAKSEPFKNYGIVTLSQAGSVLKVWLGDYINNGSLIVQSGGLVDVNMATLCNNGILSIYSGGRVDVGNRSGLTNNGTLTVFAGGTVCVADRSGLGNYDTLEIDGGSLIFDSQTGLYNDNDGTLTVSSGGSLTSGDFFDNSGIITISTGGSITVDSQKTLNNSGTLTVSSGGSLSIVNQSSLYNSGTLTVSTGGDMYLVRASIPSVGGRLVNDGFIHLLSDVAVIPVVDNRGTIAFEQDVDLSGLSLVGGMYQIAPNVTATVSGDLVLDGATLTNDGTLNLINYSIETSLIVQFIDSGILTNNNSITCCGTNLHLYFDGGQFNNSGTLSIPEETQLSLESMPGTLVTNSGTINITNGHLDVLGTWSNQGDIVVIQGEISLCVAELSNAGMITLDNSTINTIYCSVNNATGTIYLKGISEISNDGNMVMGGVNGALSGAEITVACAGLSTGAKLTHVSVDGVNGSIAPEGESIAYSRIVSGLSRNTNYSIRSQYQDGLGTVVVERDVSTLDLPEQSIQWELVGFYDYTNDYWLQTGNDTLIASRNPYAGSAGAAVMNTLRAYGVTNYVNQPTVFPLDQGRDGQSVQTIAIPEADYGIVVKYYTHAMDKPESYSFAMALPDGQISYSIDPGMQQSQSEPFYRFFLPVFRPIYKPTCTSCCTSGAVSSTGNKPKKGLGGMPSLTVLNSDPNGPNMLGVDTGNGSMQPFVGSSYPGISPQTAVTVSALRTMAAEATSAESFRAINGGLDTLIHNVNDHTFVYTTSDGTSTVFFDFNSVHPGAFWYTTDAAGNKNEAWAWSTDGQPTKMKLFGAGQTVATETWIYDYNDDPESINDHSLASITKYRGDVDDDSAVLIQTESYDYYTGVQSYYLDGNPNNTAPENINPAHGSAGDLKTLTTTLYDANQQAQIVSTTYYRYYLEGEPNGYAHGIKYTFDADSYARLAGYATAHGTTPEAITDADTLTLQNGDIKGVLAAYATDYYEYDSQHRITKHGSQTTGCSGSCGGVGLTTYEYSASNPNWNFAVDANNYNSWKYKTIETLNDNNQNIIYSNGQGQVMLKLFWNIKDPVTPTLQGKLFATFYKYDNEGRLLWTAQPSAVALPASFAADENELDGLLQSIERYKDLLHFSDRTADGITNPDYEYLNDATGEIDVTAYYTAMDTLATDESTPGGAVGYVKYHAIQQGESGTPIILNEQTYYQHTGTTLAGDATIYPLATYTEYATENYTEPRTTTYTYTWMTGSNNTLQAQSIETTLPTVSQAHNGSGNSDNRTTTFYDSLGRVIWQRDAAGYLTYTAYQGATSWVITQIVDADPLLITDAPVASPGRDTNLPSARPVETSYQYDNLGRVIRQTDPNMAVTITIYDDVHHAVFTFAGVSQTLDGSGNGTLTTTGPITMSRSTIPYASTIWDGTQYVTHYGSYDEVLTFTGVVPVQSNQIQLPGFVSSNPSLLDLGGVYTIHSLTRSLYNTSGQVIENDAYSLITNATYLATPLASPYSGTPVTNYQSTKYDYEKRGHLARQVSPTGTITEYFYDGRGNLRQTWIGTDDTPDPTGPGRNDWRNFRKTVTETSSTPPGTDMVRVSANIYDQGQVGNGNLTRSIVYPGGSQDPIATDYLYDWRNRLIASKTGIQLDANGNPKSQSPSDNSHPITVQTYDNLGAVLATYQFDGDGIALSDFASGPLNAQNVVHSDSLIAYATAHYDEQGRTYTTATYSVAPHDNYHVGSTFYWLDGTTQVDAPAITSNTWYDKRGLVAKTTTTGQATTKYAYDGLGRTIKAYSIAITDDAAPGTPNYWDDVFTLTDDLVLVQNETIYDDLHNSVLSISRARYHNASDSARGDLDPAINISAAPARVSYALSYSDPLGRTLATVNLGTNGGSVTGTSTYGNGLNLQTNGDWSIPALSSITPSKTVLVTSYAYDDALHAYTVTTYRDDATQPIRTLTLTDALGRTRYTIEAWDGTYSPNAFYYDYASRASFNHPTASNANRVTAYTYDASNHTLTLTAVMPQDANSNWLSTQDQTTQYVYGVTGSTINSPDLLKEVNYPNSDDGIPYTDPSHTSDRVSYTYNALGQVLTTTDQNGTTHTYSYDALGRVTSDAVTIIDAGVDGAVLRLETAYNSQGNPYLLTSYNLADLSGLTSEQLAAHTVNQILREYNGLGQLTKEYQSHNSPVNTATTLAVQYTYDLANGGRLTSMTYPSTAVNPNGRVLNYNYSGLIDNAISRVSSISDTSATLETYSYLGDGTVIERINPATTLSYIEQSGLADINHDGGDQYTGLDRFGRVIDQLWFTTGSSSPLVLTDRFTYTYDASSNRLSKSNLLNPTLSEEYTYDDLNRLTVAKRNGVTLQSWDLDALGNMESITTNTTTETRDHNAQNQITGLLYDNNGNTRTDGLGHTYVYDAWNRMVKVYNTADSALRETLTYDALGRRIANVVPNDATKSFDFYFSANWQVLEERLSNSADLEIQNTWSLVYIDALVCRDQDTSNDQAFSFWERLYAQQDANFNTTALVAVLYLGDFNADGEVKGIDANYFQDYYGNEDHPIAGGPFCGDLDNNGYIDHDNDFSIFLDAYSGAVLTTSAQVVQRYTETPYGSVETRAADWTPTTDHFNWTNTHQGGYFDATAGLYNFRNRWYSSQLVIWVNKDPAGYTDGLSQYDYERTNPVNGEDPLGLWHIEGDYAVADGGSTLSGLSTIVFGTSKKIGDLGYKGNPNLVIAGKTKVNLANIINKHKDAINSYKMKLDTLKAFLVSQSQSCPCGDKKFEDQKKKFEELVGKTLAMVAAAPNQGGLIDRLGIGVTFGGVVTTFGGAGITMAGWGGKNLFLGDVTNTLKDLPKGSTARAVSVGGIVFTIVGVGFDTYSGAKNLYNGNTADALGDFGMAGTGALSLAFPPLGVGVAGVAVFRFGWNYYWDKQAKNANKAACEKAQELFDRMYPQVLKAMPAAADAISFFGKFNDW